MDLRSGGLLRPTLIAGALLAANVLLSAGLAASALRARPVVVLPSARGEVELLPGSVPEEAAREFGLRYVLHFDNFTPSTIDAVQGILQRMIAARSWSNATQALEKRRQLVLEGRMSSQVIPTGVQTSGMTVRVDALRRTFIADRLSREIRATYVVVLERQPATEPNPFGLGVISQDITEEVAK